MLGVLKPNGELCNLPNDHKFHLLIMRFWSLLDWVILCSLFDSKLSNFGLQLRLHLLSLRARIRLNWAILPFMQQIKLPYSRLHFIPMPMHSMHGRFLIRRKWQLCCVFFHNAQLPGVQFYLSLHKVRLFSAILLKQYFKMLDVQHTWMHNMCQPHHLLNL